MSGGFWEPSKQDRKVYEDMEVAIVTPCGDYEVAAKFTRSVANLVAYSWMHGLKVYEMGTVERMVVHWARNELARNSVDRVNPHTGNKFTHLLWLDDDHIFNPDMLLYLARHNVECVSALYYCRTGRILPVAYVKDNDPDKYKHYPLLQVPETLMEVDAVGFGALLMQTDMLKRVEYPYFKFENCGEDIYFCANAREAGAKIHLDGSYRLGHIGEPSITSHKTYLQYMEDNEELLKDRIKVSLGGKTD
jgi:hypothetical protein